MFLIKKLQLKKKVKKNISVKIKNCVFMKLQLEFLLAEWKQKTYGVGGASWS